MSRPLCFVLMPFRATHDSDGQRVDFDAVYSLLIGPAIRDAGMEPLRSDEELLRGVFQKNIFERLVACEYAVADLSVGNPNVYYELGVRHATRPFSTILLFREGWRLPLDVAHLSALPYKVDGSGEPVETDKTRARLTGLLRESRHAHVDSPVFQLVAGLSVPEVDHARIDALRDHAGRERKVQEQLDVAIRTGQPAIALAERRLGRLQDLDVLTVVGLINAYRSLSAWDDVVRVARGASPAVARLELVRQQCAMALNRIGESDEAERILQDLLAERPSSESYGLLGRVYKSRWLKETSRRRATGYLKRAIDTYLKGFETDWRDPYPGVNVVYLMALCEPVDSRLATLLPVVRYAADRRLSAQNPDYWDHATDLGLAIIEDDRERADRALGCALAVVRDQFEPETTFESVQVLRDVRRTRNEDVEWLDEILRELHEARKSPLSGM